MIGEVLLDEMWLKDTDWCWLGLLNLIYLTLTTLYRSKIQTTPINLINLLCIFYFDKSEWYFRMAQCCQCQIHLIQEINELIKLRILGIWQNAHEFIMQLANQRTGWCRSFIELGLHWTRLVWQCKLRVWPVHYVFHMSIYDQGDNILCMHVICIGATLMWRSVIICWPAFKNFSW